MNIHLTLGDWDTQRADARVLRHEVFVVEQNVPLELEWDEMDPLSLHALAWGEGSNALGTGRLLPDGHIGRMAVKAEVRGQGIGGAILQALMEAAGKRGDRVLMLNAQTHAEAFYTRFGFVREGEEFMEAGIPHICMRRDLSRS